MKKIDTQVLNYLSGLIETLYLLSDPDTLSAVREARATPTSELETIDWRNVL